MTTTEPIVGLTDLGLELATRHARVPRRLRSSDGAAVERLRSLAFETRAAFLGSRLEEATDRSSRFESLLRRQLLNHLADDAERGRSMSRQEQELIAVLLRQTRRLVVAASVRDLNGTSLAESVAMLTVRYCRYRSIQEALIGGADNDESAHG